MTPKTFIAKWQNATLKERSAAQEHFIDLCRLLGEPTPADVDPDGAWYCFEKGAKKAGGGDGWADVWKRGCFGWEYKSKGKDLRAAFKQLQLYTPALEYPPLLIVSDISSIVIHTAFTGTVPEIHVLPLEVLNDPKQRQLLKWVFTEPERLKPGQTTQQLTEAAAAQFADLAQQLRNRGHASQQIAHFFNKLLFCLFANNTGLLPRNLFNRLLDNSLQTPERLMPRLSGLFQVMAEGGDFGADNIDWFNGGLFDATDALILERKELQSLVKLAKFDWSAIEPSIFGTLFERGLDPDKRSQLGAHFTDAKSIMRLVNPVIIEPLQAKWGSVRAEIAAILAKTTKSKATATKLHNEAAGLLQKFLLKLNQFRILDPACGSGNFLYLGLIALKDLEHQVLLEAERLGLPRGFPQVGPEAVKGLEINSYAAELARVTVWIGEIQWMLNNGYGLNRSPILRSLNTIEQRDALLNPDGTEAKWPAADVIVGNPPFLGNKKLLAELGDAYVKQLRSVYKGRVPGGADLVTYWFEKARAQIETNVTKRAGLVATNSIRGGANRKVLDRIGKSNWIFAAWSDEPWVNNGAAVRVSLVCFGNTDAPLVLNGQLVSAIHADLTSQALNSVIIGDLTQVKKLKENIGIAFQGPVKVGAFNITGDLARQWLNLPNPNGKPNSDVLRPWANGMDVTRRYSDTWIIDFGVGMTEVEAAMYEAPFQHTLINVNPMRKGNRMHSREKYWWLHGASAENLRTTMNQLSRFLATPRVAKYRIFVWLPVAILPDSAVVAIARADNATFGVLQSRFHELWSLGLCTWLGQGNDPRYTPTTTFETFPFPDGILHDPTPDAKYPAIAQAAQRLNELRENWLNPPQWVQRVPEIVLGYPERIIPLSDHSAELKKRTLTNLYNHRPAWLANAHRVLDQAIAVAYGWDDYSPEMPDAEILQRLLELNLARNQL